MTGITLAQLPLHELSINQGQIGADGQVRPMSLRLPRDDIFRPLLLLLLLHPYQVQRLLNYNCHLSWVGPNRKRARGR